MASKEVKLPKKGAVSRIREVAKNLRNQPVDPRLKDALKKKPEKISDEPAKKIADNPKKRDPDLGL